jgi:hypothetical protein
MRVVRQIWRSQLAEACLIYCFLGLYPRLEHHPVADQKQRQQVHGDRLPVNA